jgi:hypothetical protein
MLSLLRFPREVSFDFSHVFVERLSKRPAVLPVLAFQEQARDQIAFSFIRGE